MRELFELEMNVTGVPCSDTPVCSLAPLPLFKKGHNSFGIVELFMGFFSCKKSKIPKLLWPFLKGGRLMYTGAFQNVTPEQVLPLGGAYCSYLPFPLLHETKFGRKEITR